MIDTYFHKKPIGYSESFESMLDKHPFFVHCTKGLLYFVEIIFQPVSHIFFLSLYAEEKYVTKFMSLLGCFNPMQHHQALRKLSDRTIARWPYDKTNPCHNKSKHWVDDANNQRHSLIDLSYSWLTKWWPNQEFTFFLGVAQVNVLSSHAYERRQSEETMMTFWKNLAIQML